MRLPENGYAKLYTIEEVREKLYDMALDDRLHALRSGNCLIISVFNRSFCTDSLPCSSCLLSFANFNELCKEIDKYETLKARKETC